MFRWWTLLGAIAIACSTDSLASNSDNGRSRTMVSDSRILGSDAYLRPLLASQALSVTVASSAVLEAGTGRYTYTYVVTSANNNRVGVELFGVRRVPVPESVNSPPQWTAFFGFDEEESSVVWACTDTLTEAPSGWDSVQVFPSPFEILPGQSKTFALTSRRPPTQLVSFYALGSDTVPDVGLYSGSTGTFDYPTLWSAGVSGAVWGPDISSVVSVEVGVESPPVQLSPPAPNPTPRAATMTFYVARRERVRIVIYDAHGRLVRVIVDRDLERGYHSATWAGDTQRGDRAASGVYFFKFSAGGAEMGSRRVVLLK